MTKNQPKEVRIKQIVDSAVLEFIEKGFEGASMNSIAQRAQLSKGAIYHHFSSKDEILMEANDRFMEPILVFMETAKTNTSPCEGLKIYIKEYLQYWAVHPKEIQFTFLSLFKIMARKDLWPEMEEYFNYVTGFFREMFSGGIKKGEFKEHDVISRAAAIAASLDGVTPYLFMVKDLTHNDIADSFIMTFIHEIEV